MFLRAAAAVVLALAFLMSDALGVRAADAFVYPGDQLQIQVLGDDSLTQTVTVADDGMIGLPLAGQVRVGGATIVGATNAIAAAFKRYIRDPHVVVSVVNEGHVNVVILGDVVNSGEYQLRPGAHLSDAITAAGGMASTIDGAYPVARIVMPNRTVYNISLDKLLRGGDPDRDIILADRTAIYVPGPTTFDITVMGAVDHPGTVTVNEGDRLSIAIAKAGNSQNSNADLTRVLITRTEPDGKSASHPVDLYQSLEKGNSLYDPILRKGDIVYVPVAQQNHGSLTNVVFLLSRLLFFGL